MSLKSVQKSIRITPQVEDYINQQPGDNFSEKLSNLVFDARKGEAKRLERFRELDQAISRKQQTYDRISKNIDMIHQIGVRAFSVERSMTMLYDETKRLVDDERKPPGKSPPGSSG